MCSKINLTDLTWFSLLMFAKHKAQLWLQGISLGFQVFSQNINKKNQTINTVSWCRMEKVRGWPVSDNFISREINTNAVSVCSIVVETLHTKPCACSSHRQISQEIMSFWPVGGARGEVRASLKSTGFIPSELWMFVQQPSVYHWYLYSYCTNVAKNRAVHRAWNIEDNSKQICSRYHLSAH